MAKRLAGVAVVALMATTGAVLMLSTSKQDSDVMAKADSAWVHGRSLQTTSACPVVESGVDYVANDIGAILGSGAADCCTKCAQRAGCGAFTWSNYDGGTCWLKSAKGSTVAKAGVVSAVLTKPTPAVAPSCPAVESNVDYIANDIANVPGTGAADCCFKCSQRVGCGAFTWSNFNGGTCWLKSARGATTTTTGVVSAVLISGSPPPAPTPAPVSTLFPLPPATTAPTSTVACPEVMYDIDLGGADIGNVPGVNVYDCCGKCQQRAGCAAFTWTNFNGGTCWLKKEKGSVTVRSGMMSGVLTIILTTPAPAPPPKTWPLGFIVGGEQKNQPELSGDDGVLGNPQSYPSAGCVLPNYISKNNKIYVVGPRGETEPMAIKGANWYGMETGATVPLGMLYNSQNGSTAYSIAAFLQRNNFNSVRLPIRMDSLLRNVVPETWAINATANRAIKLDSYINTIKSIIKALAFRQISVLIDIHTLTNDDIGMLWYNQQISEARFLDGIDILTRNLCNNEFYNVIGIDLKNEPASATWGDGSPTDFRAGATRIGNRMLQGCPNWLAFVEGITEFHTYTNSAGTKVNYGDWWGAGLAKAKQQPVTLSIPNKVVYAPHYYTPAVYPAGYYFNADFSELSDRMLQEIIGATIDGMFGYLSYDPSSPAIVLGEFGGMYTLDRHPQKTMQRSTRYTVDALLRRGFAGGYVWSLNPESGYDWNPFNTKAYSEEGLVLIDWRYVNEPMLAAFKPLDSLPNLKPLQCFK